MQKWNFKMLSSYVSTTKHFEILHLRREGRRKGKFGVAFIPKKI